MPTIEGKLHVKYDTQQKSEKFASREFVVEFSDNPLYPQFIKFELSQEKCGLMDRFNVGDKLEVVFNLRGREWINPQGEKKYFTSLEAWKIDKVAGDASSPDALSKRTVLPGEASDDPFGNNNDLPY